MLAGFQRKYLRKLAHGRTPAVRVGASGLSDAVQRAVDQALSDHELIVVKLHQPTDKRGMARELAAGSRSELCGHRAAVCQINGGHMVLARSFSFINSYANSTGSMFCSATESRDARSRSSRHRRH